MKRFASKEQRAHFSCARGNETARWMLIAISSTVLSLTSGCESSQTSPPEGALQPRTAPPKAKTPDRLPSDTLLEGDDEAFGFRFPRDMTLSRTRKIARAAGEVDFDDLTDYVKARIAVRHAEMFGNRLVFPNARIRGTKDGVFKLTILRGRKEQVLLIEDESKPPAMRGLTEEQRWKQAGLKPNGELVDRNRME